MATPYEVSTVVSRSYIPEQFQNNMQAGQEQKNVMFLQEFQKDFEKKQQEVGKTIKTEGTTVADKSLKMDEEKKKRNKNKRKKSLNNSNKKTEGIDIQA